MGLTHVQDCLDYSYMSVVFWRHPGITWDLLLFLNLWCIYTKLHVHHNPTGTRDIVGCPNPSHATTLTYTVHHNPMSRVSSLAWNILRCPKPSPCTQGMYITISGPSVVLKDILHLGMSLTSPTYTIPSQEYPHWYLGHPGMSQDLLTSPIYTA